MKFYVFEVKEIYNEKSCIMKRLFFTTFEKAVNALRDEPLIQYNEIFNFYTVLDANDANRYITSNKILIRAYFDELQRNYSVKEIELLYDGKIDGFIYELSYFTGYDDWIKFSKNAEETIIGYFHSKKKAKKYSARNKEWKNYPRNWIKSEFESNCVPSIGCGKGFLSITKYEIL